jgi:hypothetical protein
MEDTLAEVLGIKNPFSKEQIAEGMKKWPGLWPKQGPQAQMETCTRRAATFQALQFHLLANPAEHQAALADIQTLETYVTDLAPLLRPPTDVENESYGQVCFKGTPWATLNTIPFALIALSFYKSFIVPGFSILLPVISLILPFILLRLSYNIPITFEEYGTILWKMWNGQRMPSTPEEIMNPLVMQQQPPMDAVSQLKHMAQNAWTIFAVGQTIWHPIQQARHFMTLDADCMKLGELLIRVKGVGLRLFGAWKRWIPAWLGGWLEACPDDPRQAFAFATDTPFWILHTFRCLGRFEVLLRLAGKEDVIAAEFVGGDKPVLMLKDFGDPSIPLGERVVSSVRLGGPSAAAAKSHKILTGPNRGGKSSFLRGVLMNVVLAHSFGAAFAARAQMTPFTWVADGMRLDDTPGKQSMFEREVAFGSAVLAKKGGMGLVLYDELFHSTNPPDAKRTSELFCDRLWKKENCISIVSTHVYSLARSAPADTVDQLCVAAWEKSKGRFKFSYKVQKGVCEVSSVDLLLKQYGLL